MSIKDKKLTYLTEEIVKEQVKKGILPSASETINKIIEYTNQVDLAKPSFKFSNLFTEDVINTEEYATYVNNIRKDLCIIYENFIDMQNTFVSSTRNYEIERQKLELQLQVLEDKLREKILLNSDVSVLNSLYDTFTDISKINTAITTANIDVNNREISLNNRDVIKIQSDKISKLSSKIQDLFGYITNTEQGDLSNIINAQNNNTWATNIVSESSTGMGITIQIELTEATLVNSIELELHSVKPVYTRLYFSPDGINILPLPYHEEAELINGKKCYSFPELTARILYLDLIKTEYDNEDKSNNKDTFNYQFGLSSIALFNRGYGLSSTLYSQPLFTNNPKFVLNQLALEVEEEVPLGTKIDYYVALNDKNPNWYRISSLNSTDSLYNTIVNLRNISDETPAKFGLSSDIALKTRELSELTKNGIPLYNLGIIGSADNPVDIVAGSEKLYKGRGCWELKQITSSFTSSHIPLIADWFNNENLASISYIPVNKLKLLNNLAATEAKDYKLSLTLYCDQQVSLEVLPASNFPFAIYLNTSLIYNGETIEGKINLPFNKGFNQLDILICKYDKDVNINFDLNTDLTKIASQFYADKNPMTLVTLFDLQYKIPNTKHNCYAISKINEQNIIVVNNITTDIDYEFHYRYVNTDTNDGLLFKAILQREETSKATPKLKSYRIKLM